MIDPRTASVFASHREQDQDEAGDEEYDPWTKEDGFVSLGQDRTVEHEADMEQDQEMEAQDQDQDQNVGKSKTPKPAVVQVTNHLQDMEIDDIDVPPQPSILVAGKFRLDLL